MISSMMSPPHIEFVNGFGCSAEIGIFPTIHFRDSWLYRHRKGICKIPKKIEGTVLAVVGIILTKNL